MQPSLDRSLIPSVLEESLRWNPAFPMQMVTTKQVCYFGASAIAKGQMITAWLSAANRDPASFSDSNYFDIRRYPNRHLTSGHGKHYCRGSVFSPRGTHSLRQAYFLFSQ